MDQTIAGRTAGTALVLTSAAGALVSLALLACAGPISSVFLNAPSLASEIRLSAALPLLGTLAVTQLGILYGLEAFKEVFRSSVFRAVAVSLLLVVGANQAGLTGALVGLSAGELLGVLFTHALLRRSAGRIGMVISYHAALSDARTLYRLAGPASIAAIALQSALWFGQLILVRQSAGFSEVAFFNLAYRWYLAIMFLPSSVSPIALPLLANVRASGDPRDYGRLTRLTLIGNVAVVTAPAIMVAGLAPAIMNLGGPGFVTAWPALTILAAAALPSALNNALSQTALSLNKIGAWLASDVLLAATLAATAAFLVPHLGASGLATAYLAAMLVTCSILFWPVRQGLSQSR